jgi:hypothetical protein
MLCLCAGIFIPVVAARDAFAPSWLKEGTYVKYESTKLYGSNSSGSLQFFNVTDPKFAGTNYTISQKADTTRTISSSFMWRCVSVNDTMAKLQITLDYVGERAGPDYDYNFVYVNGSSENVSFQLTGEAYVDLYSRGVYTADGVFWGTTHLWLPANPNNGQEITMWEEDSKKITSTVTITISDMWTATVQGKQNIFDIKGTIINDKFSLGTPMYDLDTGLCLSGLFWDPIFAVVGINNGHIGGFSETNINLGPEHSAINWNQILPYTIIPIAIIILVAALIIKRKKKKN